MGLTCTDWHAPTLKAVGPCVLCKPQHSRAIGGITRQSPTSSRPEGCLKAARRGGGLDYTASRSVSVLRVGLCVAVLLLVVLNALMHCDRN